MKFWWIFGFVVLTLVKLISACCSVNTAPLTIQNSIFLRIVTNQTAVPKPKKEGTKLIIKLIRSEKKEDPAPPSQHWYLVPGPPPPTAENKPEAPKQEAKYICFSCGSE